MEFSFKKKSYHSLFSWYTLTFIVVAFFVYGAYYLSGHSLIWQIDGSQQHLPLLISYRKALIEFFQHPFAGITTWSWKYGLGSDTFQIYSYYTIGDIFAYLTLLFPASKIIFAYQVMIILRMYFAGLSFAYFAKHLRLQNSTIIVGAMIYIFNAYLLYANVAQPFFTTAFIIFPLVILGIERILQGKSAFYLTFVFSWMFINNFYFAFILGLGGIIYLILRVLFNYRKRLDYWVTFKKLSFASLTSLLISAGLLLPEILAVQSSTRAGSLFANGLKTYPIYYYLALPSQLINGGNRDFYFWSALGFSSIAFFGVCFILLKYKRYPLLASTFILSFIMLLFPQFGALFNGMMSPSNRWTLMLCLPLSLAVSELLEKLPTLSDRTMKYLAYLTFAYITVVGINYYFQNSEKLFIPIIFLLVFLGMLFWIRYGKSIHPYRLANGLIIANIVLNAIYFETPYNGGFANEMLPNGAYEKLLKNRYGGLDDDIAPSNTFRVSTISNNFFLAKDFKMYNTLNEKLHGLSSYYSLQNQYLGDFSRNMQNIQYETNVPLREFDDRAILLNFLGVKHLFAQLNQPNDNKIPYGYHLSQSTRLIHDVNQKASKNQQMRRYTTNYAFPLMYWQNKVITAKQIQSLSVTQKERLLSQGVLMTKKDATGLKRLDIKNDTVEVPFKLISDRGNIVDPSNLQNSDKNETYRIVLNLEELKRTKQLPKNSELHVEINDIKYTPFSFKKQIQFEEKNQADDLTKGLLASNDRLAYYKYFRYHVLKGSPDMSYNITVNSKLGAETIAQPRQSKTSFFKIVNNGTMNLGQFKTLPDSLKLTLSKMGTYNFKIKVYAQPFTSDYQRDVKQIQKHAVKNLSFKQNGVSGDITTDQLGVITSSIPYSKGWKLYVDGKKVPLYRTNQAFVGFKLASGKHHINLVYQIPGLKLGLTLSVIGIILLIFSWMLQFKKRISI
ncbi:YfhO family protein [Ligilactobacillus hayakitensis]|uniref:YfhO family protein n=1 Tax=Ligilactobacillus hayakitensis TaxID=396716 RepID=UPI000468232C|nr:YfhO family protein [Ligilactobacillus hayakitensis]